MTEPCLGDREDVSVTGSIRSATLVVLPDQRLIDRQTPLQCSPQLKYNSLYFIEPIRFSQRPAETVTYSSGYREDCIRFGVSVHTD